MTINDKFEILSKAPSLLRELLAEIPDDRLKIRRIPDKWSIHEHACHLAEVHPMMMDRFKKFKNIQNPTFSPYLPGTPGTPDQELIDMNLVESLDNFEKDRHALLQYLAGFSAADWQNEGHHPEYVKYTPAIFLRHIMMHDQLHMYRIEELWLTEDEFLPKS